MNELKQTQLVNLNYSDFIIDLLSLSSLFTVVWVVGLFSFFFDKEEKSERWLGFSSIFILFSIWILRGKAYYVLGLIPFLYVYGAYFMEKHFTGNTAWLNVCIMALSVIVALISLPFSLPVFGFERLNHYAGKIGHLIIYPFFRWEDGRQHGESQVFADMTGWKEMTGYVAKAYLQLSPEERQSCTIYAERNYGYAGAVHFYGKAYGLPEPITFLESYTLWAPDLIPIGPMIYINTNCDGMSKLFSDIKLIGQVTDPYFREKGLGVWLCRFPKAELSTIYQEKARQEKKLYAQ
jgi:hypothetical protein